MFTRALMLLLAGGTVAGFMSERRATVAPPLVRANPNTVPAGVLRNGVLTVMLDATRSTWWLHGPNHPAETIEAFSEHGEAPLMPGPLVRASVGTEIRLSVHNMLGTPLTFFVPAKVHGGPGGAAVDSLVVGPGGTRLLTVHATTPGNYVYRATTTTRASQEVGVAGLLAGAVVIDTAGFPAPHRDRVFVIMETLDSAWVAYADTATTIHVETRSHLAGLDPSIYTINGRSWPNTERIHATAGDSLHWRVINASDDLHPMHLHGFYYRVDSYDGPDADPQRRPARDQMVVTQLLTGFSGMSMTCSPDRPGNWLFHCHLSLHLTPDSMSAARDDPYMRDMVGLAIGTTVLARGGVQVAGAPIARRHLRLVAVEDNTVPTAGRPAAVPSMRFYLEERGRRIDAGPDFSPELDLVRGEPVAVTVVNRLAEPTSVHWHGIELQDSYMDGVPGFSGEGSHLSPAIAPGDSFVARFTPPRSGTFMYHAHVDELREQRAGLEGALIVRDSDAVRSVDDHAFFLKTSRLKNTTLEINGRVDPDTVVLHVGRQARLRLLDLRTNHQFPVVRLVARRDAASTGIESDTLLSWLPVAKDGFDLPRVASATRPASQVISMGETYDFEYTPREPGMLHLEVTTLVPPRSGARPQLLIEVPIRVDR